VAQAETQRNELGRRALPWQKPLGIADYGFTLLRRARRNPVALAMGVLLLFRLGRGRLSVWAGRLWTGWQIYQSLRERKPTRQD